MKRFAYTQEGLRAKLRSIQWDQKQSVCCLLSNVRTVAKQWFEAASATSPDEILDLIVKEQLGSAIPYQLRVDVLNRKPKDAMDFALIADEILSYKKYSFAKSVQPIASGRPKPHPQKAETEFKKFQPGFQGQPHEIKSPRKPRTTLSLDDVTCFSCGQRGHYSFQCGKGTKEPSPVKPPAKSPVKPRKSAVPSQMQPKMKSIVLNQPGTQLAHHVADDRQNISPDSTEEELGCEIQPQGAASAFQNLPVSAGEGGGSNSKGVVASPSVPGSAKPVAMYGATSAGGSGEVQGDMVVCDPQRFITTQQQKWMHESFTQQVTVKKGEQMVEIPGYLDTGADLSSISSEFVDKSCLLEKHYFPVQPYHSKEMQTHLVPIAKIFVKYKHFEGEIFALVHDHQSSAINFLIGADLIYRNHLAELQKVQSDAVSQLKPVQTRSQTKVQSTDDHVQVTPMMPDLPNVNDDLPLLDDSNVTNVDSSQSDTVVNQNVTDANDDSEDVEFPCIKPNAEFRQHQLSCPTLKEARRLADMDLSLGPGRQTRFCWKGPEGQRLLYREKLNDNNTMVAPQLQLVVPKCYREEVLKMAHDSVSGHVGIKKTQIKITNHLFWPDVSRDVKNYCLSCDHCQRVGYPTDTTKAKMEEFPLTGTPFSTLEMDVFGPLPESNTGKKYLICFTCPVSKWVEAVATSSVTAKQVAKAFLEVVSRIGWPNVLVTDQAKSFTSELMTKLCELTGTQQRFSVAYHPQSHGAVERVQQTLFKMMKTFIQEYQKTWSDALPYILYAYRTSPHESLGWYTPSDVILGRNLRGPLELLRAQWEGSVPDTSIPVAKYIRDLQKRLQDIRDITAKHLQEAQKKYKAYHDAKARPRNFQVGDSVLVLDPIRHNKLQVHWLGPGVIEQKLGSVNYVVRMSAHEKKPRVYHANRLKPYVKRQAHLLRVKLASPETLKDANPDLLQEFKEAGDLSEVYLDSDIPTCQQKGMYDVLKEETSIFVNTPGRTAVAKHKLKVKDETPIKSSPYRVIGEHAKQIEEEIEEMLKLGIIQPSESPWASPVVIVPKKTPDGQIQPKVRFCVDYRKLNQVTIPDPYPMPRAEDLIEKIAQKSFLSCLDLSSGYWQIELDPESREKSAFITHKGTYEFLRMPFGLCNAGATFQRLMDIVLQGLPFAQAYIDDIVIFSDTFEDHLEHVRIVLQRLKEAGLTVKASKCQWLRGKVVYLGHWVGSGTIEPLKAKVESVKDWPIPENKKQVQSFLGLVGYYRKFIPHFSHIATPLTELTRKRMPVKVKWTPECQYAFDALKNCLIQYPILIPPDFDKSFVLQTDASEFGLGCVLLQEKDGLLHPVSFFSKKLLPRERNYSVPEKECLSIVWSLNKLRPYLWGRKFILQTDHQSLKWLNRLKASNQRLLRWSLALQDFTFDVQYIPGSQNILADSLSRMYFGIESSCEEEDDIVPY